MVPGARPPRWYHEENGFAVLEDLLEAHGGLAHAAAPLLAGRNARVVDVGCGNGALLARLCAENPGTVPFGVDRNPQKIESARRSFPGYLENFVAACAFDVDRWWRSDWTFDVMLLSPGRFLETAAARPEAFRRRVAERVDCVLLYVYSDWIAAYGDLEAVARLAGFDIAGADRASTPSTGRAATTRRCMVNIGLPSTYRASAVQCALYKEEP